MSALPGFLLRHTVTVEPYIGSGPTGAAYGPPAQVRCFVDEQTRLVRGPSGDQVTSSSTFYARLETVCPAKSRITLPGGRRTVVIAALRRDGGGLPVPDHLEVQLQ
ncbi:hypothetical protein [Streptomyces jumonjinensis]|uniref:Head-tail adaptor protein n=1 Tax=Streptomyces jumonjinensis TaxID=1945 RepID=A0A646KPP2_STRJU|nr:hypothetical protein [Streptomyces jumonjinensis]MQT03861.1 hypothetical protein [Streptomyces jumonjinensis]